MFASPRCCWFASCSTGAFNACSAAAGSSCTDTLSSFSATAPTTRSIEIASATTSQYRRRVRQGRGGAAHDRVKNERQQIRAAIDRLLTGAPQRSEGTLTVAGLAAESEIARHRLYEHHTELIAEFKTATHGGPISPNIQALQQQLADALAREKRLLADNDALAGRVRVLTAVVVELTQEASADNIVSFQRARGSRLYTC